MLEAGAVVDSAPAAQVAFAIVESSQQSFTRGLRAAVPVIMGFVPVGMTFGLLARSSGVSLGASAAFSLFVFAGASQFMALNLLAAGILPGQIIAVTFLLNFRHFLMSSALARRIRPSALAPLVAFTVTDESFAVASGSPGDLEPGFMLGLQGASWVAWNAGTLVGYLGGGALPTRLQDAMGTALYALFVALLVPRLRERPLRVLPAAIAAVMNGVLVRALGMPSGWALLLTLIVVPALMAAIPARDGADQEGRR